MQIPNELKKQIKTNILEEIESISNKEYQKRVWICAEGPEIDDFDETCCRLFDDNAFDFVLDNYEKYGITENQNDILKKFRDEFESFSDNNDWPQEFIDTPEWNRITEMAKEVLRTFNYRKK